MDKKTRPQQYMRECPFCQGSGQTGGFAGVSRFVITWEECPDCSGTGLVVDNRPDNPLSYTKQITSFEKDK